MNFIMTLQINLKLVSFCLIGVGAIGCAPDLKRDVEQLCQSAERQVALEGEDALAIEAVSQGFAPRSEAGRALKAAMLAAPLESRHDVARARARAEPALAQWECAALSTLQERAQEAATARRGEEQIQRCSAIAATLDEIAYALEPLMREEIMSVIQDTLPEEKQAEVRRSFEQEHAVKLTLIGRLGDASLEGTKIKILDHASCRDALRPQGALKPERCERIEALIPSLTGNRRMVILGEAYGEALKHSGVDPSEHSGALQERLIALAGESLIDTLKPSVVKLSAQTGCQFD